MYAPRFRALAPVLVLSMVIATVSATVLTPPTEVAGVPLPGTAPSVRSAAGADPVSRLSAPTPRVVSKERANPVAIADKFAARIRSTEARASLRAFEGAPPVVPHPIGDLNVQTCRACHGEGLRAGDRVARMASHATLTNCTQCHVEADPARVVAPPLAANRFDGLRISGYGGTRAWAGAPPVLPHTTFMRGNCVSCHGEFGYDGWRPDHLDRSNCIQCHAPAAEFDQLSSRFGIPDAADGRTSGSR